MELSTIIIIAGFFIAIYLFLKSLVNASRPVKEKGFEQAGVRVSFSNGTISIHDQVYDVKQVAGITLNSFDPKKRNRASLPEDVVIEIDDYKKPSYQLHFVTSEQAENFMQKLILALKRAGSPKLV